MDADIPAVPQSWDAHVWKNAPAPVRCVPSASLLQTCLRALCEPPETLERTLTRLPRELAQELLTELLAQRRRLTDRELRADVLICGDDAEAVSSVLALTSTIAGLDPIDAGALANAAGVEALTAILLNVNRTLRGEFSVRLVDLHGRAPSR